MSQTAEAELTPCKDNQSVGKDLPAVENHTYKHL